MSLNDWRHILSLSQNKIGNEEKEDLYEGLAWLDLDNSDIDFNDLKSLFLLAQDFIKFKGEQVNTLRNNQNNRIYGQPRSESDVLEHISAQEEEIVMNKQILQQLHNEIEDLKGYKDKIKEKIVENIDSDSSREALSEINEIRTLQEEIEMKNKFIKKLVKESQLIGEENRILKQKVILLKDKLAEATSLVKESTHEICTQKKQLAKYKANLIKLEGEYEALLVENKNYNQKQKYSHSNNEPVKSPKIEKLKKVLNQKIMENQALIVKMHEIEDREKNTITNTYLQKVIEEQEKKLQNLIEKLSDASEEMKTSANLIELLKKEIKILRNGGKTLTESPAKDLKKTKQIDVVEDSASEYTIDCSGYSNKTTFESEILLLKREEELSEVVSELEILREKVPGSANLIKRMKKIKKEIKVKDDYVKQLVKEINEVNKLLDDALNENSVLREKLNISPTTMVTTKNIVTRNMKLEKRIKKSEQIISQINKENVELLMKLKECEHVIKLNKSQVKNSAVDSLGIAKAFHDSVRKTIEVDEEKSQQILEEIKQDTKMIVNEILEMKRKDSGISSNQGNSDDNLLDSKSKNQISDVDLETQFFEDFPNYNNSFQISQTEIINLSDIQNKLLSNKINGALMYFYTKYKKIYSKMTEIMLKAKNNQNSFEFTQENLNAEIANLKAQLSGAHSKSEIREVNPRVLERKYNYLEESYKNLRIRYENQKKEYLDSERDHILTNFQQEAQIQKLIILTVCFANKLSTSVSLNLYLNINDLYHSKEIQYRNLLEKKLEAIVPNALNNYAFTDYEKKPLEKYYNIPLMLKYIEQLEVSQQKHIDNSFRFVTKEAHEMIKTQVSNLEKENQKHKTKVRELENEIEICSHELQELRNSQTLKDLEENSLRHRIVDLQSNDDSKAIVARLSEEIYAAHIHSLDSLKKIESLTYILNKEKQRRAAIEDLLIAREIAYSTISVQNEMKLNHLFELLGALREQYAGALPTISLEKYVEYFYDYVSKNDQMNNKIRELETLKEEFGAKNEYLNEILSLKQDECNLIENVCPHEIKLAFNEISRKKLQENYESTICYLEDNIQKKMFDYIELEKKFIMISKAWKKETNREDNKEQLLNGNKEVLHQDSLSKDDESEISYQTKTISQPLVLKEAHIEAQNNDNVDVCIQTDLNKILKNQIVQTVNGTIREDDELKIELLKQELIKINEQLSSIKQLLCEKEEEIKNLNSSKTLLQINTDQMVTELRSKDKEILKLKNDLKKLEQELRTIQLKPDTHDIQKTLLQQIKKLEENNRSTIKEFTDLLENERNNFKTYKKENQKRMNQLVEEKEKNEKMVESIKQNQYMDLESKYSKLESEVETLENELKFSKNETDKWKKISSERLEKLEKISYETKEMYEKEKKSNEDELIFKHNVLKKEFDTLRDRLNEQANDFEKISREKEREVQDMRIELRNINNKAISTTSVERDETITLESLIEECEFEENFKKLYYVNNPSLLIEQLRREKQLISKQNNVLRRQLKILTAKERRARLETQNMKTSVIRMWQQKEGRRRIHYEQQMNELKCLRSKLASMQNATKKLEDENKSLKVKLCSKKPIVKYVDDNKEQGSSNKTVYNTNVPEHLNTNNLIERIEAQQRRIVALELADKGLLPLVSEYEKLLSQNTLLKGQVLRLESQLLELNIQPMNEDNDDIQKFKREIEHLKSYVGVLKDENKQLLMQVSVRGLERGDRTVLNKIQDLEQTILMLRGLVSKLQAENRMLLNRNDEC